MKTHVIYYASVALSTDVKKFIDDLPGIEVLKVDGLPFHGICKWCKKPITGAEEKMECANGIYHLTCVQEVSGI